MSHKKHQFWVMMPVLGILLMSPQDVHTKYGRHIASDRAADAAAPVAEVARPASQTPKLDQLITTLTVPERQNPVNLNSDNLKEEISTLLSKVSTAEEYSRETVLVPQLDKHLDEIKSAAINLVQVENSIKDLINPDDEGDIRSRIGEAKIILEASLKDLEETRVIVAARVAAPATPVVVAPAAETPAPAVTPAARAPGVVAEETTVAADDKKEEKDPILCALEEQNKLLQQQLQGFVQQQTMIMQQLLQMSQMMMMQNMYRTPDTFNYREAYQYHQPQVAGNWVYYPNGLQPIQPGQVPGQMDQSNIFGLQQQQPMQTQPMPQMGMMGGYGMGGMGMMGGYGMPMQPQMQQPGMMNQNGQWGLAPQGMGLGANPGTFSMGTSGVDMGQPTAPAAPVAPVFQGSPSAMFI